MDNDIGELELTGLRYRQPSCTAYAVEHARRAVPLGFCISGVQGGMAAYSAGAGGVAVAWSAVRGGALGAYEWGVFVTAAAMTRCALVRARGGSNDVFNAAAAGAAGGVAGALAGADSMQVTLATSGRCWSSPTFRAAVLASARQNALMGSALLACLHLFTDLL
mmetsp:Transcript_7782/g.20589  ORF Transcript_7782/g.20589 Transcript_7782/m.20589 type:complete len:164 (-) Transcript_7782:18-509(-)